MIKLIIAGCNGKMGNVVSQIAAEDESVETVAGFDVNTQRTFNYDVYENPADFKEKADVIIDFSHPLLFDRVLNYALETKTPVVFCTTGLSDEQKNNMIEASKKIPVFYSANMSLGVNLIIELATKAAKQLEEKFDIEIVEKHHNRKIDAPSGTALAIADAINEALEEKKEYVYDRHSVRQKRANNHLGIHSVRGGTIVGEHEVIFAGNDEIIEIKHTAMSREIFAQGAVTAAKYLASKDAGLYDMKKMISETI